VVAGDKIDAVVIGAGLNGSWVAKELTGGGMKVALIDAGSLLPSILFDQSSQSHSDPTAARNQIHRLKLLLSGDRQRAFNSAAQKETYQLFLSRSLHAYETPMESFSWSRVRAVGGRGHLWGRVLLRFTDRELAAGWPIRYSELAPYYSEVEELLRLGGAASALETVPDGNYQYDRSLSSLEQRFCDSVSTRWPNRKAVVNHIAGYEPGPLSPMLEAAIRSERLLLVTGKIVSHLANIKRDSVEIWTIDRNTQKKELWKAPLVFLAASAFESVRILLNSRCGRFPNGLGNDTGLLGRKIMEHVSLNVFQNLPPEFKSNQPSYLHNQFKLNSEPCGFYMPPFASFSRPDGSRVGYGVQGSISSNTGLFYIGSFGEASAPEANRLRLHPIKIDQFGVPQAVIEFHWDQLDLAMWRHMKESTLEMTEAFCADTGVRFRTPLGVRVRNLLVSGRRPIAGSNHEAGGAQMGMNPSSSVVRPDNRLWNADNILVCDSACFPSLPHQNPTLTSMALALRASRLVLRG
jgi:choline dehydrogenase-like flavoprotein